MISFLTQEEKDELIRLNQPRINRIRRMPWADQQPEMDRFVAQLNECLTADKYKFADLAMYAFDYNDLTDRQIKMEL